MFEIGCLGACWLCCAEYVMGKDVRVKMSTFLKICGEYDPEVPDIIYHYCTVDAMLSILQNNCLWMCDLERTNDKTELKYFYDQMRKMFDDFNQKYKSKYGSKLVQVYTVLEKAIEGLYNRTAYITQISKDYVCCFSEEKDLLSQWRGYGSDGNGIAIGFNAQLLRKLDINGSRYKFIKVIYDNEKVYENIRSYMEKQMITILDDIKEEELDPENILFNLVTVVAPMMEDNYIFKNPGFVEENEWRVYYKQIGNFDEDSGDEEILLKGAFSVENEFIYPFSRSELKFRSLKDDISSYFELGFERCKSDIIKKIIIGPKCKINIRDMKILLRKYHYINDMESNSIEIVKSNCPYT